MSRGPFLRSCLLFSLLLSSSPILAQTTAISLDDPSYLPGDGQLISDSAFSFTRDRLDQAGDYVDSYALSHAFQYGVTADLSVGAGATCAYREATYRTAQYADGNPFGGIVYGTATAGHTGCGNPFIQGTYRVWRQRDDASFPIAVDLSASFSPNIVKAYSDANLSTAPGGASGDVAVALSHVFEDATLLGRVGLSLNGKTKVTDGTGRYSEYSAYARPFAELFAQYRPTEDIAVTVGVLAENGYHTTLTQYNYYQDFFGTTYGYLTLSNDKVGYQVSPSVAASLVLIPDFLTATLSYHHSFIGSEEIDTPIFADYTEVQQSGNKASDSVTLNFRVLWF